MYTPKHYSNENRRAAIAFMKRFNFGTINTAIAGRPVATHLPFIIKERAEDLVVTGHFAKANSQWKEIETNENLLIFSEPHAYVSPKHYDKQENVPTWNYAAVHAYGKAQLVSGEEASFQVLEEMMAVVGPDYLKQWNGLSMDYKLRMVKGIVCFEIEISELQFKEKLSQNKKEHERQAIAKTFSESTDRNENLVAEYMNKGGKH